MNPSSKSYFFQAFSILLLSALIFLGIKRFLPKKIFSEKVVTTKNVAIDSLLLEAISLKKEIKKEGEDTLAGMSKDTLAFEESEEKVSVEEVKTDYFDNYKGYEYLASFYEKLFQMETQQKGKVRIAYFGDSMTDGDMIVQDLRINFQEVFGGSGVGFVSIVSESAASRGSISHQFSNNWNTQSYLNVKKPISPFGVNGHVFFVKDNFKSTWVSYKANSTPFCTKLDNPTLFYGKSNNEDAAVISTIDKGKVKRVQKLAPKKVLNTLPIASGSIKEFKSEFARAAQIPFYGYNFDDGKGVHIDNFSKRGNSGLPISLFNTSLMHAFNDKLGYDLIILQYGTNVLNYGSYNYNWYNKRMTKVIEHLKACFPAASILIISVGDKGTKYAMEMKTDSAVIPLVKAQHEYAIKTKSGFVNLFTLMGGSGSMVKWVEEEPVKAGKDYTHFNFRGAKKAAKMLYDQLNTGYQEYKLKRKKIEVQTIDSLNSKKDNIYD